MRRRWDGMSATHHGHQCWKPEQLQGVAAWPFARRDVDGRRCLHKRSIRRARKKRRKTTNGCYSCQQSPYRALCYCRLAAVAVVAAAPPYRVLLEAGQTTCPVGQSLARANTCKQNWAFTYLSMKVCIKVLFLPFNEIVEGFEEQRPAFIRETILPRTLITFLIQQFRYHQVGEVWWSVSVPEYPQFLGTTQSVQSSSGVGRRWGGCRALLAGKSTSKLRWKATIASARARSRCGGNPPPNTEDVIRETAPVGGQHRVVEVVPGLMMTAVWAWHASHSLLATIDSSWACWLRGVAFRC